MAASDRLSAALSRRRAVKLALAGAAVTPLAVAAQAPVFGVGIEGQRKADRAPSAVHPAAKPRSSSPGRWRFRACITRSSAVLSACGWRCSVPVRAQCVCATLSTKDVCHDPLNAPPPDARHRCILALGQHRITGPPGRATAPHRARLGPGHAATGPLLRPQRRGRLPRHPVPRRQPGAVEDSGGRAGLSLPALPRHLSRCVQDGHARRGGQVEVRLHGHRQAL